MIAAALPQVAPVKYRGASFIWDLCRETFETGNVSFRELGKMYGLDHKSIENRSKKDGWIRHVVALAADAIAKVDAEVKKHKVELDLVSTMGYMREVEDYTLVMERTRQRHADNNLVNSNNMGVMIGQLAEFLTDNNVLDQVNADGEKICDTGAFVRLVSAVKNLNMDEKRPDVEVNVNNQVNIMDDIAAQHNSIYDDVEYNKNA